MNVEQKEREPVVIHDIDITQNILKVILKVMSEVKAMLQCRILNYLAEQETCNLSSIFLQSSLEIHFSHEQYYNH